MAKNKITLGQFLKNPDPKGTRALSLTTLQQIRVMYTLNYSTLTAMAREGIKVAYNLTDSGEYYFYLTIPSTSIKDFYYDVVIKLSETKESKDDNHLNNYNLEVFSNDPAFAYTFAYAYNKQGLIVSELLDKFNDEFLKDKPKISNPEESINYTKIIFFAITHLNQKGLLKKKAIEATLRPIVLDKLLDRVVDVDKKIAERIAAGEKEEKKKKSTPKQTNKSTAAKLQGGSKHVRLTGTTKTTNRIKSVKTTKNVKRK